MFIKYKIIGTPKPQARPRFFKNKTGYMGTFSPKTDFFKLVYEKTLQVKAKYLQGQKITGPLKVSLVFYMPIPQSISKKKRKSLFYVSKKPDIDNLVKAVLDAINYTNIWEDDNQISVLEATKIYDEDPHCDIMIEQLKEQ